MRLSGIAASIATFAMLAVINRSIRTGRIVTGATSSVVGIPIDRTSGPSFIGAVIAVVVAYAYSISRSGLALRAARDEATAARASGVDITARAAASPSSSAASIIGFGGALYAHSSAW